MCMVFRILTSGRSSNGRRASTARCVGGVALSLVCLTAQRVHAGEHHVTPADDLPAVFWNLQPGDTIYFADGEYNPAIQNAPYNHLLIDGKNGGPDQWTTLKPEPGAHPRIVMYAMTGLTVKNSSFVRIEGLELKGNGQDECEGGVQVIGSHDVQVVGNVVHDFGGSGIEGFESQLLVEGNIIWHNNWRAHYGASGISVFGGKQLSNDNSHFGGPLGNPDNKYAIIIRNNVLYDNRQQNKTSGGNYDGSTDDVTDGNGIILDRFDLEGNVLHSLVANNVAFYNGGRCVHLYGTDNADVVHNTCFQNLAFILPNEAELTSSMNNNRFIDNLVYATEGQRGKNGPSEQFVRNLFFHATMVDGDNIIDQDPLFASVPPLNPMSDVGDAALDATGYFRLLAASPAFGAGVSFPGVALDRTGTARPNPPTVGAYEDQGVGGDTDGGSTGTGGSTGSTGTTADTTTDMTTDMTTETSNPTGGGTTQAAGTDSGGSTDGSTDTTVSVDPSTADGATTAGGDSGEGGCACRGTGGDAPAGLLFSATAVVWLLGRRRRALA